MHNFNCFICFVPYPVLDHVVENIETIFPFRLFGFWDHKKPLFFGFSEARVNFDTIFNVSIWVETNKTIFWWPTSCESCMMHLFSHEQLYVWCWFSTSTMITWYPKSIFASGLCAKQPSSILFSRTIVHDKKNLL